MQRKLTDRFHCQSLNSTNQAERLKGFDRFILRCLKEWKVPGLAVGIVRNGRTIHARGYGLRDVPRRLPVTAQTSFAIGSCTKAFTATAMGLLVDEGKVNWDAPVREYVPAFKLYDPVATELMTPRDLLTHRSGLPRHDMVWGNTPYDRADLLKRLRYLEPSKTFRNAYDYNNLMYMVAGVLIEHVAGCSWEQFTQQRLLQPLGMTSVTFAAADMAARDDFALGYNRHKRHATRVVHENVVPVGPAGSMNMDVLDMCRWIAFQMHDGKAGRKPILTPKTLKQIHTPQVAFTEENVYGELLDPCYAMGWTVQPYRGQRRLTHGGCVDGFNAGTSFMPDLGIGVVVLSNVTSSPLTRIIPYYVYDRFLGLTPLPWSTRFKREEKKTQAKQRAEAATSKKLRQRGTRPSHALRDYVGVYEHPGYGKMVVSMAKGRLRATHHGMTRALEHYHYDQFELVSRGTWPWRKKVTFQLGPDGRITALAAALQEGVRDIVFARTSPHVPSTERAL